MRNLLYVEESGVAGEQIAIRDLIEYVQKCRCRVAILIAVLNKHVLRQEQPRLERIGHNLELALKSLFNEGSPSTRRSQVLSNDRMGLPSKLTDLHSRLGELEGFIAKRWDIAEKITELLTLSGEFLGALQRLLRESRTGV